MGLVIPVIIGISVDIRFFFIFGECRSFVGEGDTFPEKISLLMCLYALRCGINEQLYKVRCSWRDVGLLRQSEKEFGGLE